MSRRNSFLVLGLLVAALVGVALLAIPGSPLHKSPTLGLDLQGGLEVTLQAVPPPNRDLTEEDLDRSVEIMRNRVDKLGVSSPRSGRRATTRSSSSFPASRIPRPRPRSSARRRSSSSSTSRPRSSARRSTIRGEPVETTSLYGLLAQVQAQVKDGQSEAYYVVNTKTKRVVSGPYGSEEAALRPVGRRAARRTRDLRRARRAWSS